MAMADTEWLVEVRAPGGLRLAHRARTYADCIAYLRGAQLVNRWPSGAVATITGPVQGARSYALRNGTPTPLHTPKAVQREAATAGFMQRASDALASARDLFDFGGSKK